MMRLPSAPRALRHIAAHSPCVMYSGERGSRYALGTTNKTWKYGWNSPARGHVTSSARNECLTAACTRLYRISFAIDDNSRPIADPKSFHDELGSVPTGRK